MMIMRCGVCFGCGEKTPALMHDMIVEAYMIKHGWKITQHLGATLDKATFHCPTCREKVDAELRRAEESRDGPEA